MLLLATDSLRKYGLNRIFYFVKESEYDGVELVVDDTFDTQNGPYIKALSMQYKLPVEVVKAPDRLTEKKFGAMVKLAKDVGAKLLVLEPPRLLDFKTLSFLKKEVPRIARRDELKIAIMNAPGETILGFLPAHSMGSLLELRKFGEACMDTSRLVEKKEDLLKALHTLGEHIVHVRLSNVRRGRDHCLPQEGVLPLESFLDRLKKSGYEKSISLAVRPTELKAGDDEKVLKILKEVKEFYEENFVKR